MDHLIKKESSTLLVRPLVLPTINKHKSQASIRKKLDFGSSPLPKNGHQNSERQEKKQARGKDKSNLKTYRQFFVNPKIEEFNLRFSDSGVKRDSETERESKQQHPQVATDRDLFNQVENALVILDDITQLPKKLDNIYNQQMKMQPPAMQGGVTALMQPTGNSYAPSIPLIHLLKENKSILKDLLLRSKAGLGMDDLQKESHLSFYLATIYENKQMYTTTVKFYKRFMVYAKRLQDKIGIALGSNRLGICQYNRGKYQRSLAFHEDSIRLSDVDNRFTGMYNVGICYRKLNLFEDAVNSFQAGLAWAVGRDDGESMCLCNGQLATTYLQMELYQKALEHYQKCLHYSKLIGKVQVQLDSLTAISQISFRLGLKSSDNEQGILKETLRCSLETGNRKSYGLSICNLGILRGKRRYEEYKEQILKNMKSDQDR